MHHARAHSYEPDRGLEREKTYWTISVSSVSCRRTNVRRRILERFKGRREGRIKGNDVFWREGKEGSWRGEGVSLVERQGEGGDE
jgi:hypothetical protein